jgi:hypothetical protein
MKRFLLSVASIAMSIVVEDGACRKPKYLNLNSVVDR